MSTSALKRRTVAEYLGFDSHSELRHEFYDGEIFAMTGGSEPHALLGMNLGTALRNALRSRGCRVYTNDMRVTTPSGLWTYPDASVVCGPPELHRERGDTLLNPLALFEVLSPTTERYDRGRKFDHYRSVVSLKAVVFVSQDRPLVEVRSRADDGSDWISTEYGDLDGTIRVPALNCELSLADLYEFVEFPPDEAPTSR